MKKNLPLLAFLIIIFPIVLAKNFIQKVNYPSISMPIPINNNSVPCYLIMFWNLENYYDPFDDPATSDNEFTPFGEKHWTWKKFITKRNGIAKVIISAGETIKNTERRLESDVNYPVLVGLAEVENRFVLDQLIRSTHLLYLIMGLFTGTHPT